MKLRWVWLDGARELAVGVVPVLKTVDDQAFYADGEETVCSPAIRCRLADPLPEVDINRRGAVVEPIVLATNALLAMGVDLRKDAPVPTVVLVNGIVTARGVGVTGNTLGSHVGVSLPCPWDAPDAMMAKATIDCIDRLLYALRHART